MLYGDQLRQVRLDDWIFQGVLDVEHLPAMRPSGELHFDAVLVIGAGTAGLTAATRLGTRTARGVLLAKGVGSTHLAPARSTCSATRPSALTLPAPRWRSSSPPGRIIRTRSSEPGARGTR